MLGRSPPKHRHDGNSPLPLGMDWSPPPKKWDGRDTVWPHDPHTGWSYCVTIPSWILLPKSRDSDPVVFYRVQVGIQSPEGVTTTSTILRRFNDFLNLFTGLKKEFPKKNLPPAPPRGLLRLRSRTLLEERRCSLEEWMGRLLSDIDISRSAPVASFLELEAAARSSFYDANQHSVEANSSGNTVVSSLQVQPHSGVSFLAGSSSVASDYGSDNANETFELGTPGQGRDYSSEIGPEDIPLDQEVANSVRAFVNFGIPGDNGLSVSESNLEPLEGFSRHKSGTRRGKSVINRDTLNGDASKDVFLSRERMEFLSEPEHGNVAGHTRKISTESVGSDISSVRGSEISNSGAATSYGDGSLDFHGTTDIRYPEDVQIVLPLDQRNKMNRVLVTMQQRLATVKTDMEDLIARLNQEMAVKEYLTTKVKDLDVELESTKEKAKENLQQAILNERERFTQMQWDMVELQRKCLEMESKLKSEQDEKVLTESTKVSAVQEKELLMQELDLTREQVRNLQKRHEELELKSKADVKVLVKEVKSLRSSQSDLNQKLSQSLKEKSELEHFLRREKQRKENAQIASAKLLHECGILRNRLQECSVDSLAEEEDKFTMDSSSVADALDVLATSDNRIGLLVAEAQLIAQDEDAVASSSRDHSMIGNDLRTDDQVRKMLTDIFIDNAQLRKQVNSVIRRALKTLVMINKDDEKEESSKRWH